MEPEERLRLMEEALDLLRRSADGAGVIVEGRKDLQALEALGVGGEHVAVHRGHNLEDRIDRVAERAEMEGWQKVILLLDWDRTGGRLAERFRTGLAGRITVDLDIRRRLAIASHAKCVEHVPADLASLRRRLSRP